MLQIKTRCGITSADNYRTYEQPPPLIVMFDVGLDLRVTDLPIIGERRELWVVWKRIQIWCAKVSLGMKVLREKWNTSLITRCDIFDWGLDQSSIWHLKSFSIGDFFHFQHSSHFFVCLGNKIGSLIFLHLKPQIFHKLPALTTDWKKLEVLATNASVVVATCRQIVVIFLKENEVKMPQSQIIWHHTSLLQIFHTALQILHFK